MIDQSRLMRDAAKVAEGTIPVHKEPEREQVAALLTLAVLFGLYDAAEWIRPWVTGDIDPDEAARLAHEAEYGLK